MVRPENDEAAGFYNAIGYDEETLRVFSRRPSMRA
jgi:hypothetical protein